MGRRAGTIVGMASNLGSLTLPWWKASLAALLCAAVGAAAALTFTGGGEEAGDAPTEGSQVVTEALRRLGEATVEVTVTVHEAPLSAVTGTARPSGGDPAAGISIGERAVVDFAAGEASVTLPENPELDGVPGTAEMSVAPVLSVSDSGAQMVSRWRAAWGDLPLEGVTDTWVIDGALPTGIDATASALPALFDMVSNAATWSGPLIDAGAGVWRGDLDTAAIDAANSQRIDALDDTLAAVMRADLDTAARVPPAGPWELVIADGAATAIRAEFRAGERIFTVSWFFDETTTTPQLIDAAGATPYPEFRAALDAALAPSGDVLDDGAVPFPDDVGGLTDDLAGDIVLPTDPTQIPTTPPGP